MITKSTSKKSKKPTIILRKKQHKSSAKVKPEDIQKLVYDYTYCHESLGSLAEKYRVEKATINNIIANFQTDLNNIKETYDLIAEQKEDMTFDTPARAKRRVVHPKIINEVFLEQLSDESDDYLTDAEAQYVWILVHTSNNTRALADSGLDKGLVKPRTKDSPVSYENSLKIRGYYLRGKANVKAYLLELRERKLTDTQCDTGYVQGALINEIEFMQEESDPKNKTNLLRAIELLGKTIPGTFSETIKVEEVRPDQALDTLLEMAKKAKVTKVLTATIPVDHDDTYEVITD